MSLLLYDIIPHFGDKIGMTRERIRFTTFFSGAVDNLKVKIGQEQQPVSLAAIQMMRCSKILQIFVVCQHNSNILSTKE